MFHVTWHMSRCRVRNSARGKEGKEGRLVGEHGDTCYMSGCRAGAKEGKKEGRKRKGMGGEVDPRRTWWEMVDGAGSNKIKKKMRPTIASRSSTCCGLEYCVL